MQKDFLLFSISPCLYLLSLHFLSHHNKSMQFQTSALGRTLRDTGFLLILATLVSELQKTVVIQDISLLGSIQSLCHTIIEYLYFS